MSVVGTDRPMSQAGLGRTLRSLRDPLLVSRSRSCLRCSWLYGYRNSWPVGFDFRGTMWEPARALLDGRSIYPEPTREAVVVGNPAVYPPVVHPRVRASCVAAGNSGPPGSGSSSSQLPCSPRCGSSRVRDWRSLVLAATSPVVVHGLWYGNLTVLLVLPLALAWRYRDRAAWRWHRGRCGRCGEAVRLAARRLAAPDAALPCRRMGRRVCGRARARGVGPARVPGPARLPVATPRRAGCVRACEACRSPPSRARSAPRCLRPLRSRRS